MLAVSPGRATEPAAAEAFIADLGQETVEVLSRPGLTYRQAVDEVRVIFNRSFDIPTIGRFVLGRHWRNATPAQQQEYLRLFEDMIVETYARRFYDYSGETLRVQGSRPEGDNDVLVQSQIVRPSGAPPVAVVWRVRERDGEHRIIDVVIEGVSMDVTQRDEFSAVIQRNGGNFDALLSSMTETIEQARRG
ncbi:MAG: ABC transporter substrate-binding protein [Rhodospirillaceae bacterium]|nr:ABC transporter substrate-binding protein [Rhodospirillaceae bacterium]